MVVPCMPLVPASHRYNRSLALLGYGSLTSAWIVASACITCWKCKQGEELLENAMKGNQHAQECRKRQDQTHSPSGIIKKTKQTIALPITVQYTYDRDI